MTLTAKKTDFIGQVFLIILAVSCPLLIKGFHWMIGYVFVGAWQLVSLILQLKPGPDNVTIRQRTYYVRVLAGLLLAGLLILPFKILLVYLPFALLFVSPILALWYAFICFKEWKRMEDRSRIRLK